MIRYIQTMMHKEPITFVVVLVMIGILIFGGWNALPTPKRVSLDADRPAIAETGQMQTAPVG
jgi:hypothetical protein